MLATLLPGVREVRTPLAVGYAWLLTLWLAVGSRLPEPGKAHGLLADVYRLAHGAGLVAVGIAVSVGAYLLGVSSAKIGLSITYALGDVIRRTPAGPLTPGYHRAKRTNRALVYLVTVRLAERVAEDGTFRGKVIGRLTADPPPDPPANTRAEWEDLLLTNSWARRWSVNRTVDVERVADQFEADQDNLLWRLRGAADPIALEHDRLQAEADFRIAMFGPLSAICIVTAIRWTPWILLLFPLLFALVYVGVGLRAEAEEGVAAALGSGRIVDPALARLDAQSMPLRQTPAPP
jgi:hypothetical protein